MRALFRRRWFRVILVAATFLFVFTVTFLLNRDYIRRHTELVQVAVAARKIPAFSAISRGDVILASRPLSVIPKDAVYDPAQFSGEKQFYTKELGFGEGDIISTGRISGEEDALPGDPVRLADQGKMLVSINTDLVRSCANLVKTGTLVNAVVYLDSEAARGQPSLVISPEEEPCLGNLLVIDKKNADSAFPAEAGRDAIPYVVTFIIDKDDYKTAKTLVEYNEKGKIYLLPVGFQAGAYPN